MPRAGQKREATMGDATAQGDEARLAPLVGLVERLRAEVTELQGRWEALGEELEAKRRRLGLAEATVELLQRRQEEAASEEGTAGGGMRTEDDECASEGAQASAVPDKPMSGS
jgi:chromosome segregation ATPase